MAWWTAQVGHLRLDELSDDQVHAAAADLSGGNEVDRQAPGRHGAGLQPLHGADERDGASGAAPFYLHTWRDSNPHQWFWRPRFYR